MTISASAVYHPSSVDACPFKQRAMLMWPRLDRRRLARCPCDPERIAAYVAHRTSLSIESIAAILQDAVRAEASSYFG